LKNEFAESSDLFCNKKTKKNNVCIGVVVIIFYVFHLWSTFSRLKKCNVSNFRGSAQSSSLTQLAETLSGEPLAPASPQWQTFYQTTAPTPGKHLLFVMLFVCCCSCFCGRFYFVFFLPYCCCCCLQSNILIETIVVDFVDALFEALPVSALRSIRNKSPQNFQTLVHKVVIRCRSLCRSPLVATTHR
jgi:hypothetical protein